MFKIKSLYNKKKIKNFLDNSEKDPEQQEEQDQEKEQYDDVIKPIHSQLKIFSHFLREDWYWIRIWVMTLSSLYNIIASLKTFLTFWSIIKKTSDSQPPMTTQESTQYDYSTMPKTTALGNLYGTYKSSVTHRSGGGSPSELCFLVPTLRQIVSTLSILSMYEVFLP